MKAEEYLDRLLSRLAPPKLFRLPLECLPMTERDRIERESGVVSIRYKEYRDALDRISKTGEI